MFTLPSSIGLLIILCNFELNIGPASKINTIALHPSVRAAPFITDRYFEFFRKCSSTLASCKEDTCSCVVFRYNCRKHFSIFVIRRLVCMTRAISDLVWSILMLLNRPTRSVFKSNLDSTWTIFS